MVSSLSAHHIKIVTTSQRLALAMQKKTATQENPTRRMVIVLFRLRHCTTKASTHQEKIETIQDQTTVPSYTIPSTTVLELSHLTLHTA